MKKVLYPGSFDPITYGHMDVVRQALKTYDKVIIGIFVNSSKNSGLFTLEEREKIIKEIYLNEPKIEVISCDKNVATVDIALANGCDTIVRGLRDLTDFASEINMAALNLQISNEKVNTVAYFANPANVTISSSMVKEVFRLGKDISPFVHPIVKREIIKKFEEVS